MQVVFPGSFPGARYGIGVWQRGSDRMAGNFMKRALLSIFIDKSARDKLDALEAVKRGEAPPPPADKPTTPAAADDVDDVLPETLVRQAIESASNELERKKNLPPGRQALIEEALAILTTSPNCSMSCPTNSAKS